MSYVGDEDIDDGGEDEYVYSDDGGEGVEYEGEEGDMDVEELDDIGVKGEEALENSKMDKALYTILDPADLRKRQNRVINEIVEIADLSKSDASILLRHFKWNKRKLQDEWFDDSDKVREKIGLLEKPVRDVSTPSFNMLCPICWNDSPKKDMVGLKCSHKFCKSCWGQHLEEELGKGVTVVTAACPYYGCKESITEHFFELYLPNPRSFNKYQQFLLRSFVDDNKCVTWCPASNCGRAVEAPGGGTGVEVVCKCDCVFCFNCKEEAHRPSSCEQTKKWILKNSAESENVTWITANTKPCPKCKTNIEKSQGCNHMTCRKEGKGCGYEFCWMCLGDWKDHGQNSGGYYKCNRYEEEKISGKVNGAEQKRQEAQNELAKYMHYFGRFDSHNKSMVIGQKSLIEIDKKMERLQEEKSYKLGEVIFLKETSLQIIECRRVLKWTYVLGFYLDNGPEKVLFEFLQENLEKNTEHLHELVERPLDDFLQPDTSNKSEFFKYRSEVTNYNSVTAKFLQNLISGVENQEIIYKKEPVVEAKGKKMKK